MQLLPEVTAETWMVSPQVYVAIDNHNANILLHLIKESQNARQLSSVKLPGHVTGWRIQGRGVGLERVTIPPILE